MQAVTRAQLEPPVRAALVLTEAALVRSHCPYSGLRVAAGLLLENGAVVTGVNYESASYGLTLCAERAALARAQAEGVIAQAVALVLAACWADGRADRLELAPCGACRQWLAELEGRLRRRIPVHSFWNAGSTGWSASAGELLPGAFGLTPSRLQEEKRP